MTDIIDRLNTCLRVYEDSAQDMLKEDLRLAIAEIELLRAENDELKEADRDHLSAKLGMEKRLTAEIDRLRAQVADLTRIAGCVAVGKELADIKREIKEGTTS
jgi:hypothetical protein